MLAQISVNGVQIVLHYGMVINVLDVQLELSILKIDIHVCHVLQDHTLIKLF